MSTRPGKKPPPPKSPFDSPKFQLAFLAELTHTPEELRLLGDEIVRILAKDVLLSQVHQGRPIENADIGAFDAIRMAQEKAPHIYLTLIQVKGWASPDDDPNRNAEMVSGRHTEGSVKDGKLYVSLLTDTKVSRFYLAEASIPEDNETIPLLRGDPIPVIAGPCSAADLWCALQEHGRAARLPDTLHKRGWKSAMLAIFQKGDGSVRSKVPQRAGRSRTSNKAKPPTDRSNSPIEDEHTRRARELGLEGEKFESYVHSHRHPAFSGSFTFDISFEMLGESFRRKARVVYKNTPDCEYFDLVRNALFDGWGNSSYHIELQTWKETDDGKNRKAVWAKSDINAVLPQKLSNKLFDLVDDECEKLDAKRRRKAKLPVVNKIRR